MGSPAEQGFAIHPLSRLSCHIHPQPYISGRPASSQQGGCWLTQDRLAPGDRVGFILPTAGVTTLLGSLSLAHIDKAASFRRALEARPGR